jgi:signal transduction histidine kinase
MDTSTSKVPNKARKPRFRSPRAWWLLSVSFICLALMVTGACGGLHYEGRGYVPAHQYLFDQQNLREWTPFGGNWHTLNGMLYNDSFDRGAKLIAGSTAWTNYTVTTDLQFSGTNSDMGVIVRTNDERKGVDTYNGYYIGMRTLDGTFVLGRSAFDWREARPVPIPGGVLPNVWYRMRVTAYGCHLGASVQNLKTLQAAWLAVDDPSCIKSGRIGMRALNSGTWRNASITSATLADYEQIRFNAAQVERLEVPLGPPWWTPWHVMLLFGSALMVALSSQLTYFRLRQWKTLTITRERERLAHDIHDTMAQGFAGISYQIQGIRHNVQQHEQVDAQELASQLSVAYQLVRRCHEEASRTIAMLGSSPIPSQQKLLDTLELTARKLAGDRIAVESESRGNPLALNLRTVDSLLHIGGEAIVNAIDHSDLIILKIKLAYNDDRVSLSVEDDGNGFEYNATTAGYGILGMQRRARDIGGTLLIESTVGKGTIVTVTTRIARETFIARLMTQTQAALGWAPKPTRGKRSATRAAE